MTFLYYLWWSFLDDTERIEVEHCVLNNLWDLLSHKFAAKFYKRRQFDMVVRFWDLKTIKGILELVSPCFYLSLLLSFCISFSLFSLCAMCSPCVDYPHACSFTGRRKKVEEVVRKIEEKRCEKREGKERTMSPSPSERCGPSYSSACIPKLEISVFPVFPSISTGWTSLEWI